MSKSTILQIIDDLEEIRNDYGDEVFEDLSGDLQLNYGEIHCWVPGNTQVGFECGPQTSEGYLSDTLTCDAWIATTLAPLQPTIFPEGVLSIGDAENCHSILFPIGIKITEERGQAIWRAVHDRIRSAFAALPETP